MICRVQHKEVFSAASRMSKLPKIFWIIVGVLFAAASVAINYQVKYVMHHQGVGSVQVMGNIKVGQPAPDFTLQDLSGHPVALSGYRGQQVVLMDFWATWCGPCRMAMPGLQELADKYRDHGLEILSVNQGEPADHVRDFIQHEKYTFHVVLDQNQAVGEQYGVQGIPTLMLVDKKGVVQWIRVGYSPDDSDLKQLVEKLTKE
jgi:peroxiredoxin